MIDTTQETATESAALSEGEEQLLQTLGTLGSPEEKIRYCLGQMREALTGTASPRFKKFWDTKRLCLPLFKEQLPGELRPLLWQEYTQLSLEARQMKALLEEQSAFALEQIELAIQALEKDLENYTSYIDGMPPVEGLRRSFFLKDKRDVYEKLQKELALLGTFATRVQGLRHELIQTELRMRIKNKLFDRLSKAGDLVFPKRRELGRELSSAFREDIERFHTSHMGKQEIDREELFFLREEVKILQALAKELILDNISFGKSRELLALCWNTLKEKESEVRQKMEESREASKQNIELILNRIKPLAEKCKQENASLEEANKHGNEILQFMRGVRLERDEIKMLKNEIEAAKAPLLEKAQKEYEKRERILQEENGKKQAKLTFLKSEIEKLIENLETFSIEELSLKRAGFVKQIESFILTRVEREPLEEVLKRLRYQILERRERELGSQATQERESLELILQEREKDRQEIERELKNYKKVLAGSGLDFQKALQYRELIDKEEERLLKTVKALEEIEDKLAQLDG